MPHQSQDVNAAAKRHGDDGSRETEAKRQKLGDSSDVDDVQDESYVATLDVEDIERPIVTRERLGGRVIIHGAADDDDDGVEDEVAEKPRDDHIIALVREYRKREEITPVNGTTRVSVIGDMLLTEARKGRMELAEAVIGLRGLPRTAWMERRMAEKPTAIVKSLVSMLCTLSSRLIRHLVLGQLPRAMLIEKGIDRELQKLMAAGDEQPGIYANFVVDLNGRWPSPNEWADVITALYRYMEDDDYSKKIDGI